MKLTLNLLYVVYVTVVALVVVEGYYKLPELAAKAVHK